MKCLLCSGKHFTISCDQLLSSTGRVALLNTQNSCHLCARHRGGNNCRSIKKSDICQGPHATLLHPIVPALVTREDDQKDHPTILPTALVTIFDSNGVQTPIRCLIDLCAERTYVSEEVVQRLRLLKTASNVQISGIYGIKETANSTVDLTIHIPTDECIKVTALVVPKIIGPNYIPSYKPGPELDGLELADPSPPPKVV